MPTATISRNGTSVTFELQGEGSDLAIAHDVGKPERETLSGAKETKLTTRNGLTDPYPVDNLAGRQAFVVRGLLTGSTAYADAQTLAEDIIRPQSSSSGTVLTLDLSNVPGLSSYTVGVPSDSALELDYTESTGARDTVRLTLQCEVVSAVL